MLSNDDDGHKANDERSTERREEQDRGPNVAGEVAPLKGSVWCHGSIGELTIPQTTIDTRNLRVHHDSDGVLVDAELTGGENGGGLYAVISPAQARRLADALETAAYEHETH